MVTTQRRLARAHPTMNAMSGIWRWAARANRRWVVTTAAVFGAIEFYTQWFERLGAEPWAIIAAGLTIVAFTIVLWRYNLAGGRPATITA